MSDLPQSRPETGDPGPDPWRAIGEFKRAPIRAGCFGCNLTGGAVVLAIAAAVALLVFLARRIPW